jgi:hypothetical protein
MGSDLLFDEVEGGILTPGMQLRLCCPAPPDFILKAQSDIWMLLGYANEAITLVFFRA